MRAFHFCLIALALFPVSAVVDAQIYSCRGEDGTRIFSDEKCGPDAKVVPNITTNKPAKKSTPTAPARAKVEPKSAAELDTLLTQCNAGDMTACTTWTKSGGPGSLKEKERKSEQACEAGSLVACEERYCNGGASDECRSRVLQVAKVAGESWYLRDTGLPQADGSTRYNVRCVPQGVRIIRDITILCAAKAGPGKCIAMGSSAGQARLDLAATAACGS